MFFLDLALCCRSTCQFRWNSEKSNHMLSATSNIESEFFRNFLNMFKSKIPISTDFAVWEGAVTYSPDFMHGVPVMRRRWHWKHLHIIFAIHWDLKLVMLQGSSGTDWATLRSCFLQSIEPASSTDCCYWSEPWCYKTSTQNCTFKQIKIFILYINLRASLAWQKFSALCLDRIVIALMSLLFKKFFEALGLSGAFRSKLPFHASKNSVCRKVKTCFK